MKTIVFDMGNVLIDWDPREIVAREGLPEAEAAQLLREVFGCSEWVSMDRGTMSQQEGLARICSRLPENLHEAAGRCVRDWWKAPFRPMPGLAELIRELKELGCGLYVLTNATSAVHEYFCRLPGSDCFDGYLVSADWGMLKPQRELYEKLFETFSLDPAECFFIDDSPANIDGARCVGMAGAVFFRDMARLRRELNAAGVPVKME